MRRHDIQDPAGQFLQQKKPGGFDLLDDLFGQGLIIDRFAQIIAGDPLGGVVIQGDIDDHVLLDLALPVMGANDRAQTQIGYSYFSHAGVPLHPQRSPGQLHNHFPAGIKRRGRYSRPCPCTVKGYAWRGGPGIRPFGNPAAG